MGRKHMKRQSEQKMLLYKNHRRYVKDVDTGRGKKKDATRGHRKGVWRTRSEVPDPLYITIHVYTYIHKTTNTIKYHGGARQASNQLFQASWSLCITCLAHHPSFISM